ncbi:MAG TPA: peptidylprolyl isomerase [Nitrosopumilaceae archaeon]|nr:peptidylprolyl isomerase [Nitrosopumilaceae archaeon]
MVRSQAADYGFELNEFDPFFNYRATQYLVDNGLSAYIEWHDDRSWYPSGRDVSRTSQVMLHITAATLYPIFGGGNDLYTFAIIFPVVIGSLTTIIIFGLVRVIGGTTAGLFAALFFSISIPVIIRGTIGWFKSEPLGLFYGLLGIYLFLSGIKSQNKKIALAKLIGGGIFLSFGLASWGGIQFFILPLGLFFLALPFLRTDHKFLIWSIPVFVSSLIATLLVFERPGIDFVLGIGGLALIGPTIFLVVCIAIQKISKEEKRLRNGFALLGGTILAGFSIIIINANSQFLPLPSFRYLNAINPFMTTQDPLVDSVAEHASLTISQSFFFLSILMIFAGIGVWLIFRSNSQSKEKVIILKPDMVAFALIIGLIGVYISSAFVRLELYASISVIILSSIGLSIITAEILKKKSYDLKKVTRSPKPITKISFIVIIIALLIIPSALPGAASWITGIKAPPTILNGGTNFNIATDDWPAAMEWLKNNTPHDAVVAAWWDYGYWITTLGEKISLADNATISTIQIQQIARMLLSSPDQAWELLQDFDADYVLVYAAAQLITNEGEESIYLLQGGGDESKKQWFMRIAGEPTSRYLEADGLSGTDYFWKNTLLGNMFPFSPEIYVNFASNLQSQTYQPGFTPLYTKNVKYPADGDGPVKLVYSSPSFARTTPGPISGVFIYEVNKNYVPKQVQPVSEESIVSSETAIITTSFGDIVIELKESIAPKTVENFKKLVQSGFYDGTIFHRIVPGFVIQGGDPNTKSLKDADTWGQGGPGYSINAELSDIKHEKYIVSMARGTDINSAGSQFFIVLDNAPWLDGKYTVFGEVISGFEIVDNIASLQTNSQDQPIEPESAIIKKIVINS